MSASPTVEVWSTEGLEAVYPCDRVLWALLYMAELRGIGARGLELRTSDEREEA